MLLLSRAEVARLMDFADYVEAVEAGFLAAATGKALAPPAAAFHVPGGSYHAKAAALLAGDPPVMAIKLNGNYPGNPAANGLPTVQGVIYLADATNGRPLALMDSIEITINRTGTATTLAARHLARRDSRVATICGAGVQGRIQARAITAAAKLDTIHVWDIRPDAAEKLAGDLTGELKIDVRPSADLGGLLPGIDHREARGIELGVDLALVGIVGADGGDERAGADMGRCQECLARRRAGDDDVAVAHHVQT